MVVLVAKQAVQTGPFTSDLLPLGTEVKFSWKKGAGKVVTYDNGSKWYKITEIEVGSKRKLKKLFDDNKEALGDKVQKLFKKDDNIQGSDGNDSLLSFDGNDVVKAGAGNDSLKGLDGADKLFGQAGNDKLFGGRGNDWLDGGAGINELTGGDGADRFVFDTPIENGQFPGYTTILDFQTGVDKIQLDSSIFKGLGGKGNLSKDLFFTPDTYTDQKNVIIWDQGGSSLFYSENGEPLDETYLIAFTGQKTITHSDILIA